MIPDIGLMIGAYIVTRMLQVVLNEAKQSTAVVVFAVLTLVVAALGIGDLLLRGTTGVSIPELTR